MKLDRSQVAALPVRTTNDGHVEVLLVTSRETRRWVVPKGWPQDGRSDGEAAAVEAWEEAGVTGQIARDAVGTFHYLKRKAAEDFPVTVTVYRLAVQHVDDAWPEMRERSRAWFTPAAAAAAVDEPELKALLLSLLD